MKPPDALASKGRAVEEWTDVHFFRPLGLRIARAAVPTGITADQITVACLVVGLVAGHLFVYRSAALNALGLGLFIVSDVLDSADGQLARLRGTSTRFGRILDGVADGLRFINLYAHLGIRLMLAGGGWLTPIFVLAALFSHSHQSAAVDFIKNAFLRFYSREREALDLPEPPGDSGSGGILARLGRGIYRDYVRRQAAMFRQSVRLARRVGSGDLPEPERAAWNELQAPVVARTAWIGQNIRFAMLGVTAVVGWPAGFLWLTIGPLNLVLLALVLTHERNAGRVFGMPGPGPAAKPRRYRGVLVGLGGIARNAHVPAFLGDARVRDRFAIVAGVDAPGVTPVEGVPLVRTDRLFEFEPLDFVDICTPTATHLPLTLWALESGYHVICEKPVATTRAEAARVTRAAREAGRIVFPCHQYRYNPVWQQICSWLKQDAIGSWHLAEMSVHRLEADRGAATAALPWRGQRDHARGGVLLDHGTHLIYAFMDVAGPPVAVQTWIGHLRHADYDVEDTAHLILEYPGAAATIFLTWAGHQRENHIRITGDRGVIQWHGGPLTLERDGKVESVDLSAHMDKASYVGWFGGLFADFARALDEQDGERYLADIAQVAAVLEAAYESAESRRPRFVTAG